MAGWEIGQVSYSIPHLSLVNTRAEFLLQGAANQGPPK